MSKVLSAVEALVRGEDHAAQTVALFHLLDDGDQCRGVRSIAGKELVTNRKTVGIDEQPHLNDGGFSILLGHPDPFQVIFLVDLEVVVGHVIEHQGAIPGEAFRNRLVQERLEFFLELVHCGKAPIDGVLLDLEGFEEAELILQSRQLAGGIHNPRENQQFDDFAQVVFLLPPGSRFFEESGKLKLLIERFQEEIAIVQVGTVGAVLLLQVELDGYLIEFHSLRLQPQFVQNIWILRLELFQIAITLDDSLLGFSLLIPIPLDQVYLRMR